MSQVVKLKYPVTQGSQTTEEVTVDRPKAKHMRGIKDITSIDGSLAMISKVINQPPSFVDELDAADIEQISEVMESFLQPGQSQVNS